MNKTAIESSSNSIRILYVDDNPTDRMLVRDALRPEDGFHLVETASREEFESRLRSDEYDIILSDFHILGFDGLDVIDAVQKTSPETPVVIVTGTGSEYAAVMSLKRGAADYVVKSVQHIRRLPETIHAVRETTRLRQDRQRAEAAFRESEAFVRLLLNSTAEGIYGIDLLGNCTFCNRAGLSLLGYDSVDELLGKNMHDMIHHERADGGVYLNDECKIHQAFRQSTGTHVNDEVLWRKDGSSFPVEYWSYPITRDRSRIGLVVTFVDISERRSLEDQLRQSQKMEAIGQLAGGIAHDFNNMLQAIIGYTQLANDGVAADSPVAANLQEVRVAADRASSLTRQLLGFARQQPLSLADVEINETIESVAKLIRPLIGERIELQVNTTSTPLFVRADVGQLSQVLLNLSLNARDAMPCGGMLRINVGTRKVAEKNHALTHDNIPGDYVVLTVSDTGHGISTDVQRRMFEPFYTTKQVGNGTGLGLSVVYGIVNQHNGFTEVSSELGRGTEFRVYLPQIAPSVVELRTTASNALPPGTETILLAEDEPSVLDSTKALLKVMGYKTVAAADGQEALRMYVASAGKIDLVITDSLMPNMSGLELYQKIKAIDPNARVIVLSGYGEDHALQGFAQNTNVTFLQKPVPALILAETIRSVLGRVDS